MSWAVTCILCGDDEILPTREEAEKWANNHFLFPPKRKDLFIYKEIVERTYTIELSTKRFSTVGVKKGAGIEEVLKDIRNFLERFPTLNLSVSITPEK